jgi:hypothetical protein
MRAKIISFHSAKFPSIHSNEREVTNAVMSHSILPNMLASSKLHYLVICVATLTPPHVLLVTWLPDIS